MSDPTVKKLYKILEAMKPRVRAFISDPTVKKLYKILEAMKPRVRAFISDPTVKKLYKQVDSIELYRACCSIVLVNGCTKYYTIASYEVCSLFS